MSRKLMYSVSFILVLTLCFSLTSIARADLIGYWPLDEGAGATTADASGFGNDGTILGNPQWVAGVFGMALELDGGDDFVEVPDDPIFDIANEITVTAWINPVDVGPWRTIASKFAHDPGARKDLYLVLDAGQIKAYVAPVGLPGAGADWNSNVPIESGTWTHVAVSYDGYTLKMYKDGIHVAETDQLEGSTFTGSPLLLADPSSNESFYIGQNSEWGEYFNGLIDDVRIYSHALSEEEIQQAMETIPAPPALAAEPNPANEAIDIPRDVVLSWTPGKYAPAINGHIVYFSESFTDVNDGASGTTVSAAGYDPGHLEFDTTYYWRVDEVNGAPDFTVHPGGVWSFTTEPVGYPVANVTATASSSSPSQGPENTVNGSGLDNDTHSIATADMWLSDFSGPQPTWIQFEFDKVYVLHEMWVWNSNTELETSIGFGFRDVTIEYSLDGTDYMALGTTHEFAQAPGADGYAHNTTIDFGGLQAKYVRLTANSSWGGFLPQFGLSEVRFLHIPVRAREPQPDSGATDVSVDVTLAWRAGRQAAEHNVYVSTDEQAVIDGTAPVTVVTETSHPLSLDLDSTYYWRVDEVNEVETPTTWQGDIWNFSTHEYRVVDDFESYDAADNQIWYAWKDGFGYGTPGTEPYYPGNGTGSAVGDETTASYTEETIVYSGSQSMPLGYDNSSPPFYSETEHTFATFQDWTKAGVETLALHFKGIPPAFTQSPEGVFTMSAGGADIWGTSDEGRFLYKQLSGDGSIVCQIRSVENTDDWARVGPMIRQTLEANSAHSYIMLSAAGYIEFAYRPTTDAETDGVWDDREGFPVAPHWVRLTRTGDTFTGEHSEDGVNWVPVGDDPGASSVTIGMGQNVFIGFAYTGHVSDAMGVAEFSEVTTTGSVTGTWQAADLGIEMGSGNDAEPLYIAVEDSSARVKVVSNDDPLATQAHNWQEWDVDLKEFSNAGVNLSSVKKMYIGVGNRATPQTGGKGTLYIDDIRLYPPARVQPENMITNGDFEQPDMGPEYWGAGQPDGWVIASGSDGPYLANEKAAFLEEPWSNGTEQYAEFNGSGVYYQDVGVNHVAGQSYILSAKIGLENFASLTAQADWFLELRDADTDTVWARIDQDDLGWPDYGHWLDAVVDYTVPAADGPAGKEVRVAIGLGASGWAVDKVKLLESDAGE